MRYCSACHSAEGTIYVGMTIDVVGPEGSKMKTAAFWLCPNCEKLSRDLLARDHGQKERVARMFTGQFTPILQPRSA